jgi:stearoyl-CoA desaturase (delta-9 desaturase)
MSATVGLRGAAEMVPIEHNTSEHVVRTMVFAVPPAALGVAGWLAWGGSLHWQDLLVLAITYTLTGLGVTVGFHRLFTHRSFKTTRTLRAVLAVLGSMAVEGPVDEWVATHRKHHRFSDHPGDPHSPHVDHAPGRRGELRGLGHAHVGWMFRGKDMANPARYAKDLLADRDLRFISRTFPLWVAAGLALPFGLGVALTGSIAGGLTGLLWGGAVRIFLLHHVTFSINSLCHRSAGDRSPPAISHATWPGSPRSPSARRGTTTTTHSRPPLVTAWVAGSSIPPPGSSPVWSAATWPGTSSASAPNASRANADLGQRDS